MLFEFSATVISLFSSSSFHHVFAIDLFCIVFIFPSVVCPSLSFSLFSIHHRCRFFTMKHFYAILQYFISLCFISHLCKICCTRMLAISQCSALIYISLIVASRHNLVFPSIPGCLSHAMCKQSFLSAYVLVRRSFDWTLTLVWNADVIYNS